MWRLCCLPLLLALPGCSSLLDSREQPITVETTPPGAHCLVLRSGAKVAEIAQTPAVISLRKSPLDLVFLCDKPGYQLTSSINGAGVSSGAVASAVLWGGTGWAVDSMTGTANSYKPHVQLTLTPLPGAGKPTP
jgi:hypothetical protein